MIIPCILSLHIGQLQKASRGLTNHRTIVIPFVFHWPEALRYHLKGKGLIKVRTAPYRLGHNHRRLSQVNRDHNRPRKPFYIVDRQLVISLRRRLHIAQIQCRSGCPTNHLFPLAPLVGQGGTANRRDG